MNRTSKVIGRIINKTGIEVTIQVRKEVFDEETGKVSYSFPETFRTRALINEVTGFIETWYDYGIAKEADYLGLFKANTKLSVGDRVLFGNNICEVTNVIPRGVINPDFLEVVLERI